MLVVSGCSSDSGSDSGSDSAKKPGSGQTGASAGTQDSGAALATPEASKSREILPAKYAKLPAACQAVSGKTVGALVPSVKDKDGASSRTSDSMSRAGCSWNGLDDKGVKGSQYRWLDVAFQRYESEAALGSDGAERAKENYTKELSKARAAEGARDLKTAPLSGVGDEAQTVSYGLRKTDADFSYVTVVSRTENVVVSLTYNGTGYAGAKGPSVADLAKDAVAAAKEAVGSVARANK